MMIYKSFLLSNDAISLYEERTECFRENLGSSETCKKYNAISEERIRQIVRRSIERMGLSSKEQEAALLLLTGTLRSDVIQTSGFSNKEISVLIKKLEEKAEYFAFSEYELRIIKCCFSSMEKGRMKFLYSLASFCEKTGTEKKDIIAIENLLLSEKYGIGKECAEKTKQILNSPDMNGICEEEVLYVIRAVGSAITAYKAFEKEEYKRAAREWHSRKACCREDIRELCKTQGYELKKMLRAYKALGFKITTGCRRSQKSISSLFDADE